MPQRLLPILAFSLIALLFFAPVSPARADSGPIHLIIDGYSAELVFLNGPAKLGPNLVTLRLHNAAGQPLDHATVLVNPVAAHPLGASAHSHAESAGHTHASGESHIDTIMTQMEAGSDAGSYTSVLHFDSAGAWQVQLKFSDTGIDHTGSLAITVAEPPRDWRILGAFGGANALIIVAAGLLKRRLATTKRMRTAATANLES